jgi:hypothetical protein
MKSKDEIRKYIWDLLEEKGIATFAPRKFGILPTIGFGNDAIPFSSKRSHIYFLISSLLFIFKPLIKELK